MQGKVTQGIRVGFNWAQDHAEEWQLRRLETLIDELRYGSADWNQWFTTGHEAAFGAADRLFFVLYPADDGDREASARFWTKSVSDQFARDFADGVLHYLSALQRLQRDASRDPRLQARLDEMKRAGVKPRVVVGFFDADEPVSPFGSWSQ